MTGRYWILIVLISGLLTTLPASRGHAQTTPDSSRKISADTVQAGDSAQAVTAVPKRFQPNPKKAGLYSSIVPGLGQLYNREYWKIPVVYAGIGIAAYFVGRNLNLYQSYRQAYIGRINNPAPTDKYVGIYTDPQLKQLQDDYSKYLDLTVLLSAVGYGLQVLDAVTSAHLKNFDISRDISMKVSPIVVPKGGGVSLAVEFR